MNPEEWEAYQRKQQDEVKQIVERNRMEVKHLVGSLDLEQLKIFRRVLQHSANSEFRLQVEGIAMGRIMYEFGMDYDGEDPYSKLLEDTTPPTPDFEGGMSQYEPDPDLAAAAKLEEDHKKAKEYELEWNEDPNYPDQYRCANCKEPVTSLEDRMLRPPGVEGCPTCQQKAKWG